MSKNTKIVVTLIPKGCDQNSLHFTLSFNPRLPDTGFLSDYHEILNWPSYANFVRLFSLPMNISFFARERVDNIFMVGRTSKIYSLKISNAKLWKQNDARNFWNSVMPRATPVSGWLFDESRFDLAEMVDLNNFKNRIIGIIDEEVKNVWKEFRLWDENFAPSLEESSIDENIYTLLSNLNDIRDLVYTDIEMVLARLRSNSRVGFAEYPVYETLLERIQSEIIYTNKKINELIEGVKREEETVRLNRLNSEFHKQFSILGSYPNVLRGLGWVVDCSIDIDDDLNFDLRNLTGGNGQGFVKIVDSFSLDGVRKEDRPLAKFLEEVDFLYTFTAFSYKEESGNRDFSYGYFPNAASDAAFAINDDYLVVKNGCLATSFKNEEGTSIQQISVNLTGKSYLDSLLNIARTTSGEKLNISSTKNNNEGIGITLTVKNLVDKLKNQLENQPLPTLDKVSDSYIIWGHHLDSGYRVDVASYKLDENNEFDENTLRINSLVERRCEFYVGGTTKKLELPDGAEFDEGFIGESFQRGRNDELTKEQLIVGNQMFSWPGWSLVAPLKKQKRPDSSTLRQNGDSLRVIITVPEGSVTPLRLQTYYLFRLRVVDICGNSKGKASELEVSDLKKEIRQFVHSLDWQDECWSTPILYLRTDGIDTPGIFFPRTKLTNRIEDPRTLIVQTNFLQPGASKLVSQRRLTPPRANQYFISIHSVLDKYLKVKYLKKIKGHQTYRESVKIGNQITPRGIGENSKIPFFVDPAVDCYTFSQSDQQVKVDDIPVFRTGKRNNKTKGTRSPFQVDALTIELNGDDARSQGKIVTNFNVERNKLMFVLPPGVEFQDPDNSENREASIATKESELQPDHFGPKYGAIKINARPGSGLRYFLNTPDAATLSLNLIHAVQQPCLIFNRYGDKKIFRARIEVGPGITKTHRSLGETSINLQTVFDYFPVFTAVSFNLIAKYDILNGLASLPKNVGRRRSIARIVKSDVLLTDFFANAYTNKHQLGKSPDLERDVDFPSQMLSHTLGDTNHYRVSYSLEVVSKFKDIFLRHNPRAKCSIKAILQPEGTYVNVLNSQQPPIPIIDSVVPLVTWEKTSAKKSKKNKILDTYYTRSCTKFRIYFRGSWFVTGEGEQVAIFYDSSNTVDNPKDLFCSQVGYDPIHRDAVKPSSFNFEQVVNTNFLRGKDIENLVLENAALSLGPGSNAALSKPLSMKALVYNVKADTVTNRWYIEFEYDRKSVPRDAYSPFFKLALSRFQKNSLYDGKKIDCRFSPTVLTSFFQGLPNRKIKIDRLNKSIEYQWNQVPGSSNGLNFNEVYVFVQHSEDDVMDISSGRELQSTNSNPIKMQVGYKAMSIFNYGSVRAGSIIHIEEYEFYFDKSIMVDDSMPRNNYQKRLVLNLQLVKLMNGTLRPVE
ncbi:hypothetical protein [Dyadobacter sp. OTU695]|uniref:hypothetical protein n=1 Tax=Dyadobacter sp. OTU695 TaxID=3043860 RepID=UPI00313BF17A